jgi:hypothetical protein
MNDSLFVAPGPLPEPDWIAGNPNNWDNGIEGNYWSDYTTRYNNVSEIANTGVGNTPYFINENNIDHYPLLAPCDIYSSDFPTTQESNQTQTLPTTVASILTIAIIATGILAYFKKYKK